MPKTSKRPSTPSALRKKPFEILRHLVAHPKKIVTHEDRVRAELG